MFGLGFLVSSIAKRDPVGKKPKRKLFANEGLLVLEKEVRKEVHRGSIAFFSYCALNVGQFLPGHRISIWESTLTRYWR